MDKNFVKSFYRNKGVMPNREGVTIWHYTFVAAKTFSFQGGFIDSWKSSAYFNETRSHLPRVLLCLDYIYLYKLIFSLLIEILN